MMKKYIFLFFAIISSFSRSVFGQDFPIRGKVYDEANKPLEGVTVRDQASSRLTSTKADGTFTLYVPAASSYSLRFTYTGYTPYEMNVTGKTPLEVKMLPNVTELAEATVVSSLGLTRKAKSVTYSSQSVNANTLTEARDINVVNGLAGKVAGLQVTTTGQPGSSSRVVIRGEGSLTGNNQPLWVVDGVPIANDIQQRNDLDYGNTAADLNPDDIESIEVLKGPNAAALYGSMAANGAILVTTKKGKIGNRDLGISINQNMMLYTITEFPAYQNVYGEGGSGRLVPNPNALFGNTGAVNMGTNERSWGAPMLGQPINDFSGNPIPGGYLPQPENITDFYKSSLTNVSNIGISKSDAVSSFRLSYTYTKSDDVLKNQNLKNKHNISLNATRKLGSRVTLDARLLFTNDGTKNRTYRNLSNASPMSAYVYLARSANLDAFTPWTDQNGNAPGLGAFVNTENPYWMIYENSNEDVRNRYIGGITATVELTKNLKFRGQATGDLGTFKGYEYRELGGIKQPNGFYSNRMQDDRNWNYEAMLMFNKDFSKDLNVLVNLATNLATTNSLTREAYLDRLLVHDMPSISNSNSVPRAYESLIRRQVGSFYGNATIGYKDFLFLDVTGRNDRSSTLPQGNNSYFYPSVGASFLFSDFLRESTWLSYGKLRASWARVGNSAPVYSLYNTWSSGGLFLNSPTLTYSTQLKNEQLKPEKTVSREIGMELAFLQNRIQLNATVYKSNSTDQIITATTPAETGYTSRIVNAGEMQNKGIELTAIVNPIKRENLNWQFTVNWSKNDNKVLALADGMSTLQLGGNLGVNVYAQKGQPYGVMLGNAPYKVGDKIIVQASGRTYYESNQYVGIYRPKWIGSFGSNIKYKAFDLSFLVNVKWGGSLYSASYGRANGQGTTVESLKGRDEYLFSALVLGENDDERRGIGQQIGNTRIAYDDLGRVKGIMYDNSYLPLLDANGNIVYDENGRMIPGDRNKFWSDPQPFNADYVLNNTADITFDATAVRLSELVFGYTIPSRFFQDKWLKGGRISLVGRNLWLIYRKTPQGIDPESANTSGNAQGIESGGSFPYAQYGLDLKINF